MNETDIQAAVDDMLAELMQEGIAAAAITLMLIPDF